ncbi:hypothetical protein [Cryobacterium sp. M91]|uniref:DUF7718 family protein n=1 Tax=Cryobacterium sp. M91 TaxID=2048294 RepID=UPI0011B0C919|nr:hypothetical protein [Cryobacterium sp. M91]
MARNFGRDAHRASKKAAASAFDKVVEQRWANPPLEDCEEETIRYLDTASSRVTQRVWRSRSDSRIVDCAVVHEIAHEEEWHEVAKIDCSHQEVHRHEATKDKTGTRLRTVIRVIYSQADVEDTYQNSVDEIFDNLVENEGKWRHGR